MWALEPEIPCQTHSSQCDTGKRESSENIVGMTGTRNLTYHGMLEDVL